MPQRSTRFRFPKRFERARTDASRHGLTLEHTKRKPGGLTETTETLHVEWGEEHRSIGLMLIGSLIRAYYGHHVELRWQRLCQDEEWITEQHAADAALEGNGEDR